MSEKSYDVLKVNSRGSLTLPPKWLQKKLGVQNGDMVLVEQVESEDGDIELRLTKFDPQQIKKPKNQKDIDQQKDAGDPSE